MISNSKSVETSSSTCTANAEIFPPSTAKSISLVRLKSPRALEPKRISFFISFLIAMEIISCSIESSIPKIFLLSPIQNIPALNYQIIFASHQVISVLQPLICRLELRNFQIPFVSSYLDSLS